MTEPSLNTVFVDNGAYDIKAFEMGAGQRAASKELVFNNSFVKSRLDRRSTFLGRQFIDSLSDYSGLCFKLAFERGYLVDWSTQTTIWNYLFCDLFKSKPENSRLLITEPICNFESVTECMLDVLFEDFGFGEISIAPAALLTSYNNCSSGAKNALVVDSGFSYTHVVPIINNKIQRNNVKRIDVGGKMITNYLKELVSFRYLNMNDEVFIVNQIKEDVCRVSADFLSEINDMKSCPRKYRVSYKLANYLSDKRGSVIDKSQMSEMTKNDQVLNLTNELIVPGELLFSPSNIGLNQMGVSELIHSCINSCVRSTHSSLLDNIILSGGSMNFDGVQNRIRNDIASVKHDFYRVNFFEGVKKGECHLLPLEGAKRLLFTEEGDFSNGGAIKFYSRAKYNEIGPTRIRQKFKKNLYNN